MLPQMLTQDQVYQRLDTVIDPELGISIVKLGLIYEVIVGKEKTEPKLQIVMTLTTPGCPLSAVFDKMVRDALFGLPDFDPEQDLQLNLTFDPPWVPRHDGRRGKSRVGI
jgi:metal-sulfur cluster biosynthetic enzyme